MNFTLFSSAHGTFSRIDHILGHKFSLGKFKKIEIISSIFSDDNVVRLDVNYNKPWKILKEMGIPDRLTCLLRNMYTGQEATVRTGHGTTEWEKEHVEEYVYCHLAYLTYMQSTS